MDVEQPVTGKMQGVFRRKQQTDPLTVDFHAVFDSVPGNLLVVGVDEPRFTIVAATDCYLQTVGKERDEILGLGVFEAFPEMRETEHATNLGKLRDSFRRVIATRKKDTLPLQRYDLRSLEFDQLEERYWSVVNTPVLGADGTVQFIMNRVEDVTAYVLLEHKEGEQAQLARTERVRADGLEDRFRRALEIDTVGVIFFDPAGDITSANDAFLRMGGYTRDDLHRRRLRWDTLTPPEWIPASLRAIEELKILGSTTPYEKEYYRKDGSRWWGLFAAKSLSDHEGVEFIIDITGSKRAQQALHEQHRLTEAITNNASVALFIMDGQQHCLFMNPAAEKLTGYTLDELRGHALHDVIHHTRPDGSHYPLSECPIDRALPEDNRMQGEEVFVHKAGNFYPVAYTASPIREHGGVIGTVIEVRDISERKRAQDALRESQERLQQVFQQAPVAIVVLRGCDFLIELANPFYQALLQGRELIGRRFADVVPELGTDVWDAFRRVLDTGEPFLANDFYIPYDQDGDGAVEDHWFNVVYHPLREADGYVSGIVAISNEVTAQVRSRQELEQVNRNLEEFAFAASHDLQEPLRMVSIYTQLLLQRHLDESNENAKLFAQRIRDGVSRLEMLIRDLLLYSRAIHRETERVAAAVNLDHVLQQVMQTLSGEIGSTGALVEYSELPTVSADESQLYLVFQNLLSNALKYSREGVVPRIAISVNLVDGEWIVRIEDNGIGFDQQYADQIFGLFKRLSEKDVPGTGLGLAICRRIIERYGGRIWAESRRGEGSTFFFSLPS